MQTTRRLRAAAIWLVAIFLALLPAAEGLAQGAQEEPPRRIGQPRPTRGPVEERQPFVPGELLVRFRPGASAAARASVRARHGLRKVEDLPLPGLELVRTGPGRIPERAAAVARDAAVLSAEPNHLWYPAQVPPPNDPEFDRLWGLHNTGQTGGTSGADIDALAGWELAADTEEIVVAVVDTGVWTDHPDLQEAIWLNRGELPPPEGGCEAPADDPHDCNGDGVFNVLDYEGDPRILGPGAPTPDEVRIAFEDGVDDDGNGFVDDILGWDFYGDDNTLYDGYADDHGTHVAGTIAAAVDNGIAVAGVSEARIMPLKFLGGLNGSGTSADAVKALDYAIEMGAQVSNNSWGGGGFSRALFDKIQEADENGQLFIAAAGNEARDNDSTQHFPSGYAVDNIVSVAATNHDDDLAPFSNWGEDSVDLGAPGSSILSTIPYFSKAVLRPRDAGTGATVLHTFGLEGVRGTGGVSNATQRRNLLQAALSWMEVETNDAILVVDDDEGASFETPYLQALEQLGYSSVTTVTVGESDTTCTHGPDAETMAANAAVVWLTGDSLSCTLTPTDQEELTGYLNGQTAASPRNLLLFGQDIGFDLTGNGTEVSGFLRDVLGADFVADADYNFSVSAVAGSPYEGLADFSLDPRDPSTHPGGQRYSSAIAPREGAMSGLQGTGTNWFSGTSMATPHVTGAVAHVMAKSPELGHLEVKARILDSGDPLPSLAGKTVSGNRLNLAGALTPPPPSPPRIRSLGGRYQRHRRFPVSWFMPDGAEVARYRVQHRWRHFNGKRSGWSLLGVFDAERTMFRGRPGRTHCFRARAIDEFGQRSTWSSRRCTSVPLNDGALGRRGPWRRVTGRPAHYLSSFSRTRARGAIIRRAGIRRAREAALVFTRCPRCGRVEIRWKGEPIQRINMRSAKRRPLRIRRLRGVKGRGVLEVVVLSRKRPVIIEGLGVAVRP